MNTARVLTSVAEHLDGFELAEPIQVTAAACPVGPRATLQLSGESLPGLAAELLAWADTLDNATAFAWVPAFDVDAEARVFLELRGRLTDDTPVKIFGALTDGPDLPLTGGDRIGLSWALLDSWADLGAVVA